MIRICPFLIFINCFFLVFCNPNIAFLILTQDNEYNSRMAINLQEDIIKQYQELNSSLPDIYISNKNFSVKAAWTITPLVVPLLNVIEEKVEYIFILEDYTHVSVALLLERLRTYNSKKENWIGHSLYDLDASVIHHFAFYENPKFFKYPHIASGMVFTIPFLKRLVTNLNLKSLKKMDFHIDAAYEFALLVYDNGNGPMIQNDNIFCSSEGTNCASYPKSIQTCGQKDVSSLVFAVKTYHKFHDNRVKIVKNTWGKYAKKLKFFSDYEDPNIPTIPVGIPNTERGHCEKTRNILNYLRNVFRNESGLLWIALVDDDTILSVSRISSMVTCYPAKNGPVLLGERYRFGENGFDYPTGGAGIVMNKRALDLLANKCKCPDVDAPDDMVLGACADQLSISLIHIPQMHQARPYDYAPGRLLNKDAVTFHKHWMIDPMLVYREWFEHEDSLLDSSAIRNEL